MRDLFASFAAGRFGRRQTRERGARIPVIVVTGFLGAGKTTLVKRFLESPEGRGTAVVVNEFGEAGIDDALLRGSAEATRLIGNGCLCCNFRSDLQMTLHRLVVERTRGEVPPFARVLIETSGLADPSPILTTFATDRALGGEFHVEALAAVIAAGTGIDTLDRFVEARRQIALADRIVVAKTDLADANAIAALRARLAATNPRARIGEAAHGALDPDWLVAPDPLYALDGFVVEAASATHTDGITSFTFVEHAPIAFEPFARAMETLIALRGVDLLRVKGILQVEGCVGPVVVQFVQHVAHPPVELDGWPDGPRVSRLVFVTRGISERPVRQLFDAVRAMTSKHTDTTAK